MHTIKLLTLTVFFTGILSAQNRIIFNNNVFVTIANGANLVVDNTNANAVTLIGGGNIISEGENNVLKWNIGVATGNFVVPFTTNSLVKIPLAVNIVAAGTGTNSGIVFSTYETSTDANIAYPSDVTNMNSNCNTANGLYAIDRFWRIDASSYNVKPTPVIDFTYDDAPNEIGGTNTIVESQFKAERFNAGLNAWQTPTKLYGMANSLLNTVSGVTVSPTDFFKSWTLIDTAIMTIPIGIVSISNNTICSGNSSIITPSGASTYTIIPGALTGTSFTVSPVVNTTYTVSGTNANGCSSSYSNNATATVFVSTTPTIALGSISSNTICSGNNAIIKPSGASTYTLMPGSLTGTNFTVTPLTTTVYTINGSNSFSCASSNSSNLTLTITVNATPTIALGSVSSNTICSGNSSIITPSGASNYTLMPGALTGTNFTVTPLATTVYTISGSNSFGCVSTNSANLTLTITVNATPTIALGSVSSNTICSGNSSIITPSGASNYTLMPGSLTGTNFTVTPLATTVYTISGSSSLGCVNANSGNLTLTITVNSIPVLIALQQNILCFGQANGSVTLTPSGGTPIYTISPSTTTGLIAGIYTYTVTDSHGCNSSTLVSISQPSAAIVASTTTIAPNTNCIMNNGSAAVTVTGGTPAYTINWSNNESGPLASALNTGISTFTITDANGCTKTSSVLINGTTGIVTNASSQTNVNCFGTLTGAVTYSTLGVGPFSYSLSSSANTITNNTGVFTSLTAGTYTLLVTGAGACFDSDITIITQPSSAVILAAISISSVACYGGTAVINASASGGTMPYSFNWQANSSVTNSANYPAGFYSVSITDANNCSTNTQTFTVSQPTSSLTISSIANTNISCFDDVNTIIATVSGGSGIYTYHWQSNSSNSNTAIYSAGIYTMIVVDANNCASGIQTVTVTQPVSPVTISEISIGTSCLSQNTGSVTINVTGGTPLYKVLWSNGETGLSVSNIAAGILSVNVTDANGCKAQYNTTIVNAPCAILEIPQFFTPNGDGKNDVFFINGVLEFPNNKVNIFNRWGSLVYQKNSYANDWNGKSNIGDTFGKDLLPSGVYFIVFDFGDEKTKPYSSYIELRY